MNRNIGDFSITAAITLIVIIVSTLAGYNISINNYGHQYIQEGAAVAGIIPSLAGVFLAAYAIFRQIQANNPQVIISEKYEVYFQMLKIRLTLIKERFVDWDQDELQRELEEDDFHENFLGIEQAAEIDGVPDEAFETMKNYKKTTNDKRKEEFDFRIKSSVDAVDQPLIQLFITLEPIIHKICIEKKHKEIYSDWKSLICFLNDISGHIDLWDDYLENSKNLKNVIDKIEKTINALTKMEKDKTISARSLQKIIFSGSGHI